MIRAPRVLTVLAIGRGVGMAGAILAFAFFSLFLRQSLDLPIAVVGLVVSLMSAGAIAGAFVGGLASDRLGRRPAVLLTMSFEAAILLAISQVHNLAAAAVLGTALGLADGALWPTFSAVVADVLPPAERQRGFAMLSAALNAGAAIGPAAGGFFLSAGFGPLFFSAAMAVALATAGLAWGLPETRPAPNVRGAAPRGYGVVLRDRTAMGLLVLYLPQVTAYGLLTTFFPLAVVTTPGIGPQMYGILISGWGALVAVIQLPTTRALQHVRPLVVMASGMVITGLAFVPMVLWRTPVGFAGTIVGLAFGEVLSGPPLASLVANLAPPDARARYQSMIGLTWSVGGAVAPGLAGLVYGTLSFAYFWLAAGFTAAVPAPLLPGWAGRWRRIRQAEELAGTQTAATGA